jgi:anti-anti-sigma regulatory factor
MPRTGLLRPALDQLRRARQTAPETEHTLAVRGELDFCTVGQLCQRIEGHLTGRGHLTLDLTGATFYDQAAIDALAEVRSRAQRSGCRITFANGRTTPVAGCSPAAR